MASFMEKPRPSPSWLLRFHSSSFTSTPSSWGRIAVRLADPRIEVDGRLIGIGREGGKSPDC